MASLTAGWTVGLVLCLAASIQTFAGPVSFNETFVEERLGLGEHGDRIRAEAIARFGFDSNLGAPPAPRDGPRSLEPRDLLEFIVASAAPARVVYPTERYFYYRFSHHEHRIAGNLRFTDVERGVLHIGYYDVATPRRFVAATFSDGTQGVEIDYDPDTRVAAVRVGELGALFVLADMHDLPERVNLGVQTGPGEQQVAVVLDESGHLLHLLYHEQDKTFFYVRSVDAKSPETLAPVLADEDLELVIGQESRYVFHEDPERDRLLLVGVDRNSILQNNYFDGPFDQVPPDLDIRDKLHAAYPYTRGYGGIDPHGNFLAIEGQRVAISPYQTYSVVAELVDRLTALRRIDRTSFRALLGMTYESKRDFHELGRDARDRPAIHELRLSRAWSAKLRGSVAPPRGAQAAPDRPGGS